MQSGTADHSLDRAVLGNPVCKIHFWEEEHPSGLVDPSGAGPSHRVVASSWGVQCHLQGVWLP